MKKYLMLLILILFSISAYAQSYNLKYDFEKGKTYLYSDVTVNDITQQMMGSEMKVNSTSRMFVRVVADDKSDNGISLIISLDSAVSQTKSPQMDTTMVIEQVIGKRTKILLDSQGYVKKREVIDTIEADPMMQLGKREAMQFTKLPTEAVKIGDTWSITDVDSVEMMGGMTIMTNEIQFTLASKEEKLGLPVLKIPFTSKVKIEGKGNMMGFEFFLEGGGTAKGEYFFNQEEGIPVLLEISQAYDVTMAAAGDQNMIIPISQEVKMTRSLVK